MRQRAEQERSGRRRAGGAVLLALAVLGAWALWRAAGGRAPAPPPPPAAAAARTAGGAHQAGGAGPLGASGLRSPSARAARAAPPRAEGGPAPAGAALAAPEANAAGIAGLVVGPDGAPVAGALLMAHALEALPRRSLLARPAALRHQPPAATASSAADGSFALGGLAPGAYAVTARAAGFRSSAAVEVELAAGGRAWVRLELRRGAAIAGRVLLPEGAAAAGVRVEAVPEGGRNPFASGAAAEGGETTSAADGSFRLEGLAGRRFTVTAWPDDPALAPAAQGGVRPGTEDLVLRLVRAQALGGRVLEAGTGAPVAGAQIEVEMAGGVRLGAASDAQGAFRVAGVVPGRLVVRASAAGYAPFESEFAQAPPELLIELLAGAAIEGQVIRARDGAPLEGAVVYVLEASAAGRRPPPRAQGLVELLASGVDPGGLGGRSRPELEQALARTARTDAEGRFRLEDLPAGPKLVLAAHPEHPAAWSEVALEGPGEVAEVTIALADGGAIAGTVLDEQGAPRAAAEVFAFSPAGRARSAETDARGSYTIRGLAPGEYLVALGRAAPGADREDAAEPERGPGGMRIKTAHVEAGRTARVDFGTEPRVRLEGTVSRAGQPVAGEQVNLFPAAGGLGFEQARTDQAGRYALQVLPGRYVLRVENYSEPLEVPPALARLVHDVELPTGALSGRVVAAPDGAPLRARVTLYRQERPERIETLAAVLGSAAGDARSRPEQGGAFRIEQVPPGQYTLVARADGYIEARLDGVRVSGGAETSGLVLALEPGGLIRGTVRDARGSPVPQPLLWVVDVRAPDLAGGDPPRGDDDGRYEVRGLAPGTYLLHAVHEQHAPVRQRVEFGGGELELDLVMPEGGALEVAAFDAATGAPLPGATVELFYPDGARVITGLVDFVQPASPTGPDGRMRRSRLPPGALLGLVRLAPPGEPVRERRFEVVIAEGGQTELAVGL
ncbi:MAG: hypothetical protein KatS3mg102_0378 [Planctomycetota bacterium]|nr:MAG: hypothetical protein KatS3mg102_0378 [Planctomycetota bacterium]